MPRRLPAALALCSGLALAVGCYVGVFFTFRQLGPRSDRQDIDLLQTGVPQR